LDDKFINILHFDINIIGDALISEGLVGETGG